MDEQKNCIFVARKEYTTYLVYKLYPSMYIGIKSLWEEAKRTAPTPRDVYPVFQNKLARVRKWNQDVIEGEYNRIIEKSECYYLEELIKRVFVLNTQILAAVNMTHIDPNKKIKLKVPKGEKFVHHCYKECARAFYENAILMEDRPNTLSRVEQLKNLQKSYKLIMTCIENTIRDMLPIESLLNNSMEEEGEGEEVNPAMVFQSQSPVHTQLSNAPLSTYPTINNFLQQQQHTIPAAPSNGSLQPSMTELGTIPLPSERISGGGGGGGGGDIQIPKSSFDPDSLFAPVTNKDDEHAKDEVKQDEPNREDEQRNERNEELAKTDYKKEPPSIPPKPFSLNTFNPFRSSLTPDGSMKTIFFGKGSTERKRSDTKRNVDNDLSDGSDKDIPRSKRDIGGEDELDSGEVPVLSKHGKTTEKLDLDVYSSNNELPLKPSPFEPLSNADLESTKQSVPPIEDLEKENFFSDVE